MQSENAKRKMVESQTNDTSGSDLAVVIFHYLLQSGFMPINDKGNQFTVNRMKQDENERSCPF